jgi:hypothetical protein
MCFYCGKTEFQQNTKGKMKPNIRKIRESTGRGTAIRLSSIARHLNVTWIFLKNKINNPKTANTDPVILGALKYIRDRSNICNIERIGYLSKPHSLIERTHIAKLTGYSRQKLRLIFNNPKRYRDKPELKAMNAYREHLRSQGIVIVNATIDKQIKKDTK